MRCSINNYEPLTVAPTVAAKSLPVQNLRTPPRYAFYETGGPVGSTGYYDLFGTKFMRAIGAAMAAGLMVATFVSPAGSASAQKPENPWHVITDFETDSDHGYTLRQSPFDTMDHLQLAAVPRGNRIHYNAPSKCVPSRLKSALKSVAAKYGPITVNSTYRSPAKNRKIGGKKSSWHLKCAAIDFRVHGRTKGLISFLRKHKGVGGYKRYRSGFYHIDTGPKRTW